MISSSRASPIGLDSSPVSPRRPDDDRPISRHPSCSKGSQIPPQDPIVAPGASSSVDPNPIPGRTTKHGTSAMEMSALWKPQNGFHSALEISHRTRDSHIPTAAPLGFTTRRRRRRTRRTACGFARRLDNRRTVRARLDAKARASREGTQGGKVLRNRGPILLSTDRCRLAPTTECKADLPVNLACWRLWSTCVARRSRS